MKNILLLFLLGFQLLSCQDSKTTNDKKDNNCPESGFCVENSQLHYNQKHISIGMPVKKFIEIFGKQDRTVIDSTKGSVLKEYYWKKKMIVASAFSGDNFVRLNAIKVDSETGEYFADYDDFAKKYPDYKSINDIIKKYGKYDSIKEKKTDLRIHTFYVWDKLGMSVSMNKEKVSQINIYPLHVSKTMQLELEGERLLKSVDGSTIVIEKVDERERKDHQIIFDRHPKNEYKGKFSYYGNTIDFSKIGDQGWNKMVSGLKISGDDYAAGGDSKAWFRELRESPELRITFNRYSNERAFDELSEKNLGKIDGVESIQIWNFDLDE